MRHYYLIGQTPVECSDLLQWAREMGAMDIRVALTVIGPYEVSTVFLGLDHNWAGSTPALFETMIFAVEARGGPKPDETFDTWASRMREINARYDQELLDSQWRYGTWLEAEAGHEEMVRRVEAKTGIARTPLTTEVERV